MDSGYTAEIDSIDKDSWHNLLLNFDDASFYQTWSYGAIRWGNASLSHLILRRGGEAVSMAQLRIAKLPMGIGGIAYLPWGPMWRPKGFDKNLNHLRNMLIVLRAEYVTKRRYLLRVVPKLMLEENDDIRSEYEAAGFRSRPDAQESVFVNLYPPIDAIRTNLRKSWKRSLKAAEKEKLEYIEGRNDELFEEGLKLVTEMKKRKQFVEFKDMEEIMLVNKDLPAELKLNIVLNKYEGEPVAVLGWFPFGRVGYPILGGTGNRALELKASFPLWWKMVEYYKSRGSAWCDLAGAGKEANPGGFFFKTGLGGGDDSVKPYVGEFEGCENPVALLVFKAAYYLRERYRSARVGLNRIRGAVFPALAKDTKAEKDE